MTTQPESRQRRRLIGEILRYLLAGGLNTALGLSLIFTFMHVCRWSPTTSNMVAYTITMFTSFLLQKRFTFRSRADAGRELLLFTLFYWVAYLGNLVALSLMLHWKVSPIFAQLLSCGVFVVISFSIQRGVVFAQRHRNAPSPQRR